MTNDRWPTFDRELLNGDDLTLQYVASEGTIYQIFEISGGDDKLPPLKVTPDLLIRDLDFVDEDNQFNKDEAGNKMVYYHESRGNCLIRVHENSHKKAILYIQALNEEMSLEFVRDESRSPTLETPLGRFVNTKPYFRQSDKQRPTEERPASEEVATKSSVARKLGASWSSYRVHRKSAPKLEGEVNDNDHEDAVSLSSMPSYERSDGTDASGDDDEDNKYQKLDGILHRPSVVTQRRILELIHSWQIISTMNNAARAVLNVMKEHLENGKGNMRKSFAATQEYRLEETEVQKLDFKGFLVASRRFQEFQIELQKVEAHFSENLATIDLWLGREKSRQAERPRWSFNDESRWRAEIQKFVVTNDRSIREFRSYHQKLLALIEATTKDLEIMHSWLDILRNDLELRRGEDIKRFTYVTVVFLPLGFATGVFSTSGAPAGPTLINMILTAITTLTITVLALVGYKFADSPRSREELMETMKGRRENFQEDTRMKIHKYRGVDMKREQVIEVRKCKEELLIRGTGNLDERFREDVERRVSSDADTVINF
ncbi:hypothetical protein CGCSCA1_v000269 [Colletotrichum siamense]|nr:hypothetical protein CGCSCA1_v000269 [Colletotrichum siamense]